MDHPNRVGITAPSSDSSTRLATTAFVAAAIAAAGSTAAVVNSIGGVSGAITLGAGLSISGSTLSAIPVAGTLISVVYYSGSQSITIPSSATKGWVRMRGGTGASGAASGIAASGGTAAAGYLEKYLTGLTGGLSIVYTEGQAGVAGAGSGSSGGNSILASSTQTITTLTATGTNGSSAANGSVSSGTAGGTATNGDFNLTGADGQDAFFSVDSGLTVALPQPGMPGVTMWSRGTKGVSHGTVAGTTNGNPGQTGLLGIWWFT